MQKLIGSLTLALVAQAAAAQCVNPTGTSYGSGDDFVANGGAGINIGFSFPIAGTTYDHIHPSSNGFVYLSDGTPTYTNSDLSPSAADMYANEPRVAVLWDDMNLVAANGAELFVDTSVAGQVTISWINVVPFGQTGPFSMGCTLYATGQVDFNYTAGAFQTTDAIVGVSPGLGTATAPASVDLSAQAPNGDDMTHELFPANSLDLNGSLLSMIPTLPGWVPVVSTSSVCASFDTYGMGCPNAINAVHELFDGTNPLDICGTGTAITILKSGNGYTMIDTVAGTYVAPTAGTVVSAADDAWGAVPLSSPMPIPGGTTQTLQVLTNGMVSLSGIVPTFTGNLYTPTAAGFEEMGEPVIAGPWYDWSPNQAGQIVYEEIGGVMYVTWDAVQPYNGSSTDTFQYQFNLASGDCTIVYETTSFSGVSAWHTPLFGITLGSPESTQIVDMSATLSTGVTVDGTRPLAVSSNAPRIGGSWDLTTSNIEAVSPLAVTFFGTARVDPGLPMTTAGFNAPGCSIYINTVLGTASATNASGTALLSIAVPGNPALAGQSLTAQSVALTLSNPSFLVTSNGVEGTFGN